MNFNYTTFESFQEIYEYLVYQKQNIHKLIQKDEDYNTYMKKMQKKYSLIEDNNDSLYYHKMISELEDKFMCKKKEVIKTLQKISLILDTFQTYQKICDYEQKYNEFKEKLRNGFDMKLKDEMETIKRMKIGNPDKYSMLIPVNIISDHIKKEEYLKDNFLNHRLMDNLKNLLEISNLEALTLIKTKKKNFFKFFKKNYYNRNELISKQIELNKELNTLNQIEGFLSSYNQTTYFCPFCPYQSTKEFDVCFHYHTTHSEITNICPNVYSGFTGICVNNSVKCPYCPKTFDKINSCDLQYHIKIKHLFEADKIDILSKYIIKELPMKKTISIVKPIVRKKIFEHQREINYSIVDKLHHEYNKLFREPRPCLVKESIEDEIDEILDEDIVGNQLHLSIDTALVYSEKILYTKLFKLIRKSLGKELFNKAGIQKNFGYDDGMMTIENEVDGILLFVKEQLFNTINNNIYENASSNYNIIIKEFSDNFDKMMTYVDNYIEETGQQDTHYPTIENDSGQLLCFGSGSGENFDTNWQKVVVPNTIPDIDEDLIPLYINITFENF